jgi:hypothetical protein
MLLALYRERFHGWKVLCMQVAERQAGVCRRTPLCCALIGRHGLRFTVVVCPAWNGSTVARVELWSEYPRSRGRRTLTWDNALISLGGWFGGFDRREICVCVRAYGLERSE